VPASGERQPVFFYDLGSVWCYLAAERIMSALPVVPEWEPVVGVDVDAGHDERNVDRGLVARRVAELGLQPLRWPQRWPADPRPCALAATYAKRGGRAVAFSLAAFRQQFAGGRDIGEQTTVLIAAAACEIHPSAVLKGMELRSTAEALRRAGERARAAGIVELPAIALDGRVFGGAAAVERVASELVEGAR